MRHPAHQPQRYQQLHHSTHGFRRRSLQLHWTVHKPALASPSFSNRTGGGRVPHLRLHAVPHNSISAVDANKNQAFSGFSPLAPLVSPRWTNLTPLQQGMLSSASLQQPPATATASQPQFTLLPLLLPFGWLNSPRSPYPLMSPNQLGFPQLPLSPTVPVPSPRWRGF